MKTEYGTEGRDSGYDTYTIVNGERVPLYRELHAVAIKYAPGIERSNATPQSVARVIGSDPREETFLPEYGLKVFAIGGPAIERFQDKRNADEQLAELSASPDIDYATPVFRHSATSTLPMYVSNRILLKFKAGTTEEERADLHAGLGGRVIEALGYTDNGYLIELWGAAAARVIDIANAYAQSPLVEWANPDFIKCMSRRVTAERSIKKNTAKSTKVSSSRNKKVSGGKSQSTERGEVEQWHLDRVDIGGAWAITRGSSSVKVAITDDGVDVQHREFAARVSDQFDFGNRIEDGSPKLADDRHGTPVASVAVASGIRAKGAAPECSLMAVRTSGFMGSRDEADMFRWCADRDASVINCSWGPPDNEGAFALGDATRAAIDYCVTRGRSGLGTPVVFAAGNGNESVSSDGYASNPQVIAVAACDSEDKRSWYSDRGAEIFICAPSNGGSRGIFTADRLGATGYNPSRGGPSNDPDYYDSFGGTSSAAPLVTGIIGLMISANPQLREADIREILRDTADKIQGESQDFYNRAGHSESFGYGRINAGKAVEEAARRAGGGGIGTGSDPGISAVATLAADAAAPSFQIDLAGRSLYSVEVATDAALFNFDTHSTRRNADNFYGSWEQRLESQSPYTLPSQVWNRLAGMASQLFYRAHVADDLQWSNHAATTYDRDASQAPSISITPAGNSGGQTNTPTTGPVQTGLSISAPNAVERNGAAPTLTINKGGRRLYAVELASEPALFNAATDGQRRTSSNFYASWEEQLSESVPFTLNTAVWDQLKHHERLWYRTHVADDESWTNYAVSTADSDAASAPSFAITAQGVHAGGGSGSSPVNELIYPSGARFNTVVDADAPDYADPDNHGVPLIATAGKRNTRLSANFRLSEFVASSERYARLSPDLIEAVQATRSALGKAIKVEQGYTRASSNRAHASGLKATLSSRHASAAQLMSVAQSAVRGTVSVSISGGGIELDLTAAGSRDLPMSAVRDMLMASAERRSTVAIVGPKSLNVDEVARFYLEVPTESTVWIELASSVDAMNAMRDTRDGYYRLRKIRLNGHGVYQVSDDDWRVLASGSYLHYRAGVSQAGRGRSQSIELPSAASKERLVMNVRFDLDLADRADSLVKREL